MSAPAALALVVAVGLGTYAMRAVMIVAFGVRALPSVVVAALRHVGPAVLAALVVSFAAGGGGDAAGVTVAEGVALAVAAGVAWWTRNLVVTLVAGMAALWSVTWLL